MTPGELNGLEALCNAATKGQWFRHKPTDRGQDYIVGNTKAGSFHSFDTVHIVTCDSGFYGPRPNDANFICASREAMPKLIAEVRRLRKALERYGQHSKQCPPFWDELPCNCGFEEAMK